MNNSIVEGANLPAPASELRDWGCPYCGQTKWRSYRNVKLSKGLAYGQCSICHLVYPLARPGQNELDALASSHYEDYSQPVSSASTESDEEPAEIIRRFRGELSFLEPFLPIIKNNGLKVLEVGCGDGTLLAGLKGLGCEVTGVEPDPTMAKIAGDRGVPVVQELFRPGISLPQGSFDLIIFRESLYHLFDLKQTIALARELLAEDRYIYIKCFNIDSLAIRHFAEASSGINGKEIPCNFSPRSLTYAVTDSGFTVLDRLGFLEAPVGGYAMRWKIVQSRWFRYPRDLINRVLSYGLIRIEKNRNFAVVARKNSL